MQCTRVVSSGGDGGTGDKFFFFFFFFFFEGWGAGKRVRDGLWTPGGYYISKGLWIEMKPVSPEFQLEHCKL